MKMIKPFIGDYPIIKQFGFFEENQKRHNGIDWQLPKNTEVCACFDGVISRIEKWQITGMGRSIYIRSNDSQFEAVYSHLEKINVEINQIVRLGEIIGASGRSGQCSDWNRGGHLHFGLLKNGVWVNPLKYFNFQQTNLF